MKLKSILLEIGTGNIQPYDYQETLSGVEGRYAFKTDGGFNYTVEFDLKDPLYNEWAVLEVGFGVIEKDPQYMTQEGNVLRVLNTVTDIVKNHVEGIDFETYSGIKYLIFTGTFSSGKKGLNNKRSRVYEYFIEKKFPGLDVKKEEFSFSMDGYSGDYLTIDLKDEIN